jgi:hypothetical protein
VCYGVVKNVPAPCVNTSKLIYQVNDGAVDSIDAVYDRGVPLLVGRTVLSADVVEGRVRLALDDDGVVECDHVLAATGFRVDVRRLGLLAPDVLDDLALAAGGYPRLGSGFESSVRGLHFVGAASAWSHGPLMRFVAGTPHTGRSLARNLQRRRVP